MENLEKNDELCIYGAVNQTTEDDIMEARNQAQIFKEEFWVYIISFSTTCISWYLWIFVLFLFCVVIEKLEKFCIFQELVTMSEHVEKLATATSEVSFLIGAETLAMVVAERLYSIQQKVWWL